MSFFEEKVSDSCASDYSPLKCSGFLKGSFCSHYLPEGEKATRLKLYTVKETGNVEVFRRLGFTVAAEREDDLFESDRFEKLTEVEMIMQLSTPQKGK